MSKPTPRTPSHSLETESTVVLVGGNGGLFDRYREALEERGLRVRHFEKRVPPGARRSLGRVAAIFVVVSMVSHSLRDSVKDLADDGTKVVYLRTGSVSAVRAAALELSHERAA